MKLDKTVTWHRANGAAPDVKGKKVAVIGGTGGIGRALSQVLAARGASVIVVGQTFRDSAVPAISFVKADLSLMSEAQRIARLLPAETLDFVIFTTGIFAAPERQETHEGLERDLAISYLSRFAILQEIAPRLGSDRVRQETKARVFVMGYPGSGQIGTPDDLNAERSYKSMAAHMNTVAGNEILVLDAAMTYPEVAFFGLNPGLIKTNIRDNFFGKDSLKSRVAETLIGLFTPTVDAYAENIAPLLASPDIESCSGTLFNRKGQAIMPSDGLTKQHIQNFMAVSERLLHRALAPKETDRPHD